jgi:signal transduction histidine kinase
MVAELHHVSYAMVHDMRAPLRAMGAYATLLVQTEEDWDPVEARDYARRIAVAAARLDKLITDAVDYTKILHQQLPVVPVDLSRLLRGLIESYPNLHPDSAEIRLEEPLPVVLGSESLLTQCFSNLLGNAVKFVAPGSRPRIRVRAEPARDQSVRIWVEDNGIGIPDGVRGRLFGMFQRFNTEFEGTGIGLAIVRKVTEQMGGSVGVESELGKGSRFWVQLRGGEN